MPHFKTLPSLWCSQKLKVDLFPKQAEILDSEAPRKAVYAGRKFGKTLTAAAAITQFALEYPGRTVLAVAYSVDTLFSLRTQVEEFLQRTASILMVSNTMSKKLENGSWILFRSAGTLSKGIRDKTVDFLVVEEAALLGDEAMSNIRPCLACGMGLELWIGVKDEVHSDNFFIRALSSTLYKVWIGKSEDNPYVNKSVLEVNKALMSEEDYAREHMGIIAQKGFAVFKEDVLARTFDDSAFLDHPEPGTEYYAGLDYGKLATPSVLCIVSKKDDHFHVDFLRKFRLGVQYGDVNDAVIAACRTWQVGMIKVDRTGPGERPYEELVNAGVPVDGVRFTAGGTWDYLLGNMLALMEENKLRTPRHPELLLELRGFQFIEKSGELRPVTHRTKDLVCALTLALDAGISRSGHVRAFAGVNRIVFGVGGRRRESLTRNELM